MPGWRDYLIMSQKDTATNQTTSHSTASPTSNFNKGLIIILISSLMLSFQNVVTRIILSEKVVFGTFKMGGIISPSFGNSLLILVLRMAIVLPIMALIVAPRFYKNTWQDIKDLTKFENRNRFYSALGSGTFLFLSQFLMYVSLGNIPTGVSTTIFFIYPTITILLVWVFFKDKPQISLFFAMITIYIGGYMTIPPAAFAARGESNLLLGATTAALSGVAFAGYIVLIKIAKMHPAPFTVVSFSTILTLGVLILPLVEFNVAPAMWTQLLIGAVVLAFTTLVGYLLTNVGVPMVGPAIASVIASSGPAVTALMALIIIHETLEPNQIIGVFLVTLWVVGISVENMKKHQQVSKPSA